MATVTATIPSMGSTIAETSSSSAVLTANQSALVAHLSSGVAITPPVMTGTAVPRALAGTATAA